MNFSRLDDDDDAGNEVLLLLLLGQFIVWKQQKEEVCHLRFEMFGDFGAGTRGVFELKKLIFRDSSRKRKMAAGVFCDHSTAVAP